MPFSFGHDYYLSHAPEGTSLAEFARVAKAAHEIEACFKQAKSEAGLGDYQVRNWVGWHHHQTLALMASWFLSAETRRGGKETPALTVPVVQDMIASLLAEKLGFYTAKMVRWRATHWMRRTETARFYWHRARKMLPKLRKELRQHRKQ